MKRCTACRAEFETLPASGVCDPCATEHGRAERIAQGLPPMIEDPATLARIAFLAREWPVVEPSDGEAREASAS